MFWGRIMRKPAEFVDGPDLEDGVLYPSSDGKPMAETDFHVLAIRWLLDALEDVFKDRDDIYIAGNVNWFWQRGNPRRRRSPDAMVVVGVEKGPRRSFRSWNEGGAVPAVCFEMASARTLLGFRRRGRQFHSIRPDSVGGMASRELGLCLVPERLMLRLVRTDTGELVLTREEQAAAERARASAATAQAEALAAEVARLKAQLKASGKSPNGAN
jgi:Putative restriction endonuclease